MSEYENRIAELPPGMRKYLEFKKSLPSGTILLYRMGDFYEIMFNDACYVSFALNLPLSYRHEVPMCGVHASVLDEFIKTMREYYDGIAIAEFAECGEYMVRMVE